MHIRLALLLSLMAALILGRESAAWHVGRGVATDGDTVKIGEAQFRLKGIRAPEGLQGKAAEDFIRTRLIADRWIACRETGQLTFSRYEAFCYTLAGEDIGAAVIRAGLACASHHARWRVTRYIMLERSDRPSDCGYGA